jgi:hypothetical protein
MFGLGKRRDKVAEVHAPTVTPDDVDRVRLDAEVIAKAARIVRDVLLSKAPLTKGFQAGAGEAILDVRAALVRSPAGRAVLGAPLEAVRTADRVDELAALLDREVTAHAEAGRRLEKALREAAEADERHQDLSDRLAALMPESWDGDGAFDAIAIEFVATISARLAALGGSPERWEERPDGSTFPDARVDPNGYFDAVEARRAAHTCRCLAFGEGTPAHAPSFLCKPRPGDRTDNAQKSHYGAPHQHVWQDGRCVADGHDREPEFGSPEAADKFRSRATDWSAADQMAAWLARRGVGLTPTPGTVRRGVELDHAEALQHRSPDYVVGAVIVSEPICGKPLRTGPGEPDMICGQPTGHAPTPWCGLFDGLASGGVVRPGHRYAPGADSVCTHPYPGGGPGGVDAQCGGTAAAAVHTGWAIAQTDNVIDSDGAWAVHVGAAAGSTAVYFTDAQHYDTACDDRPSCAIVDHHDLT